MEDKATEGKRMYAPSVVRAAATKRTLNCRAVTTVEHTFLLQYKKCQLHRKRTSIVEDWTAKRLTYYNVSNSNCQLINFYFDYEACVIVIVNVW